MIVPQLSLGSRFMSTFDKEEESIVSRKEHMESAVKLMMKEPLTGVGLSNFQVASKKYFNLDLTEMAHNIFLQFGAETGIPSMLLLMLLIGMFYYDSRIIYSSLQDDSMRHLIITIAASFTGLVISGQFGDIFVRGIKEYFALMLAMPYAINRLKNATKITNQRV
jgi:O-Antigen ligase.